MNILVVHEVSYLKKVVYEYQDFAERLASRGHKVTVVDFDPDSDGRSACSSASRTGIGTVSLESAGFLNLPVFKYLTARRRYKQFLLKKLRNREIDIVFLYSVFINGTNTVRLCRKFNVPVCYRSLDIYHRIRKNFLISPPLYWGEKYIYKNCDAVIATNQKLSEYVKKMSGDRCRKLSVLHHGIDRSFFNPRANDPVLRKKFGFHPEDKIAVFLGTTYDFAGLDVVIQNFAAMKKISPNMKIMIVGAGDYDRELKRLIAERGLERDIVLTGFQPYQDVPAILGIADVAFNSFRINDITRDIIPVKIVQYLACGKPLICTPLPDVVKLFPEKQSGILYCDIAQGDRFATLMAETIEDAELRNQLSGNAVRFIEEHFDMNNQILKLENELSELCRK